MNLRILFVLFFYLECCAVFAQDTYTNPFITLADPYVFLDNGVYYAFGTTSSDGFLCWSSTDLVNWTSEGYAFQETPTSWGDNTYWAPEVKKYKDKYYMSYSCKGKSGANDGKMLLCLAESDSPDGPYTDLYAPWFDDGYQCIDSDIFIDSDSSVYLYFDVIIDGGGIYMRKLSEDDLSIEGDTIMCIKASQPWELQNMYMQTNEGSFVFRYQDKYFMTYSGNSWQDPYYGIGYATADSPFGPWVKSEDNPIIQLDEELGVYGPGHNSITTSPDGKEMFIVYHTHISETNKSRKMNIDRLFIDDNMEIQILGATRSPQPMPSTASMPLVNVDSLILDQENSSVLATDSIQLSYIVLPDTASLNDVMWMSADESVATVSKSGMVTAISPSKNTSIIATTYDGNKRDTFIISVTGIGVSDISLDVHSVELKPSENIQLHATILPEDATNKDFIWSTSNSVVAVVTEEGIVYAIREGTTNIIVTSKDGNYSDSCFIDVRVPTIPQSDDENNIKTIIYPNPANNYISLVNIPVGFEIRFINNVGNEVLKKVSDSQNYVINISEFKSGMYYVIVSDNCKKSILKLIKAN